MFERTLKQIEKSLKVQYEKGYVKGVDECAERLTDWMFEKHGLSQVDIREINEIVEQLKKGGAT